MPSMYGLLRPNRGRKRIVVRKGVKKPSCREGQDEPATVAVAEAQEKSEISEAAAVVVSYNNIAVCNS